MSVESTEYFAKLGRHFATTQDELLARHDSREAARARLLQARPRALSRPAWGLVLAPALAIAAALLLWVGWARQPAALSFDAGVGPGKTGQLLTAASGGSLPLRFSDGSVLELEAQASSRVLSVAPNGARVELARGALQASVVHRADTSWAVLAGPFKIAVTGTRFLTQWDPLSHDLAVSVQEGSVVVSGGSLRAPERVVAGKTLHVSLAPSAEALSLSSQGAAAAAPPVVGDVPSKAPLAKLAPSGAASDPRAFDAVFESGSPTDLVTLAQELRHRGDLRGATRALVALRSRFPGDPRSRLAAHTLTDLALSRRDCAEARRWWDAYVAQSPGAAQTDLAARVRACGSGH